MKKYAKYVLFVTIVFTSSLSSFVLNNCYAQTVIQPNLEPGVVYNRDYLPEGWFNFFHTGRSFWGKNTLITWISLEPYSYGSPISLGDNSLMLVMDGQLELNLDNRNVELHEMDCLYLEENKMIPCTTDKDPAEILMILWPINTFHAVNQQVPGPKMIAPPALSPSSEPSVIPGEVFSINDQQYSMIADGVYSRIVQFSRAQLCQFRMEPGSNFTPSDYSGEAFFYIMQGSLGKTDFCSTTRMKKYDVMYLSEYEDYVLSAGPDGCEAMVLFTPARQELTMAMETSREKFHSIFPLGIQLELVIDAQRDNPDITNTEGPSWKDGKLYFAGPKFHVYDPNASCYKLCDDYDMIGTFPLPNGNFAACCRTSKSLVEITPTGDVVKTLADSYDGEAFHTQPNDLVVDKKGGIYFTFFRGKHGVLYMNPEGGLMEVVTREKHNLPNGCILSPDGKTFYLNTSGDCKIWAFDVNEDGTLSNGWVFTRTFNICPDGLTVDTNGNIYAVTQIGVEIFDPKGNFIGDVMIPKARASNCVFGGNDLSTLYITTHNGKIFSVKTNMKGVDYPMQ